MFSQQSAEWGSWREFGWRLLFRVISAFSQSNSTMHGELFFENRITVPLFAKSASVVATLFLLWTGESLGADFYVTRVPSDLMYRGLPLEPFCFPDLLTDPETKTYLKHCPHPAGFISGSENERPGFIGYRYREAGSDSATVYRGYKYLGDLGGLHVILEEADDGGSLHISNLLLLFRRGDTIRTVLLEERYGCNRGVYDAAIADGHLRYSCDAWLSELADASGLFDAEHRVPRRFNQFDAPFHAERVDLKDGEIQDIRVPDSAPESGKNCFSNVESRYRARHKTYLSNDELRAFIGEVAEECKEH